MSPVRSGRCVGSSWYTSRTQLAFRLLLKDPTIKCNQWLFECTCICSAPRLYSGVLDGLESGLMREKSARAPPHSQRHSWPQLLAAANYFLSPPPPPGLHHRCPPPPAPTPPRSITPLTSPPSPDSYAACSTLRRAARRSQTPAPSFHVLTSKVRRAADSHLAPPSSKLRRLSITPPRQLRGHLYHFRHPTRFHSSARNTQRWHPATINLDGNERQHHNTNPPALHTTAHVLN